MMPNVKIFLLGLLAASLTAGCQTTPAHITNLTPQQEDRNPTGLYPIEAAMESSQQTLRWDTIRASVVVNKDSYPMRPTRLMKNRWETLVPVAPGNNTIYYRFRFDYDYAGFGDTKNDSKLSPVYRLQIIDH
ncbi:MAG TPA: hypothetical protein VH598_00370 [Verrucomicrobiae bacterium]|nr:hypothetical protein [Verrucomicrobiae bacterium]